MVALLLNEIKNFAFYQCSVRKKASLKLNVFIFGLSDFFWKKWLNLEEIGSNYYYYWIKLIKLIFVSSCWTTEQEWQIVNKSSIINLGVSKLQRQFSTYWDITKKYIFVIKCNCRSTFWSIKLILFVLNT